MLIGSITGIIMGFAGVGGGFIITPALVHNMVFSQS